jgi:hypothetical protein
MTRRGDEEEADRSAPFERITAPAQSLDRVDCQPRSRLAEDLFDHVGCVSVRPVFEPSRREPDIRPHEV